MKHNDLVKFLMWLEAHGASYTEYEDFDIENTDSPYLQIATNYLGDMPESKPEEA